MLSIYFSDLEQSLTKYCSSHEDVLEWLLDVEDRLKTMGKVSENLDQIKIQFQVHGDYMQYLDSNQEEIGKVDNLRLMVKNAFSVKKNKRFIFRLI